MANPVIDKFFQDNAWEGRRPFSGAQIGGPQLPPGAVSPGGIAPGGVINTPMPVPGGAGEPPWVARAREQRKLAKQKPPMSTPESMPGGIINAPRPGDPNNSEGPGGITGNAGGIVDPWGPKSGSLPPSTGPYIPGGPLGQPGQEPKAGPPLGGGVTRGGIMGGQGIPKQPRLRQRFPQGPAPAPAPPKMPSDGGAVFGKVPGGGF